MSAAAGHSRRQQATSIPALQYPGGRMQKARLMTGLLATSGSGLVAAGRVMVWCG